MPGILPDNGAAGKEIRDRRLAAVACAPTLLVLEDEDSGATRKTAIRPLAFGVARSHLPHFTAPVVMPEMNQSSESA